MWKWCAKHLWVGVRGCDSRICFLLYLTNLHCVSTLNLWVADFHLVLSGSFAFMAYCLQKSLDFCTWWCLQGKHLGLYLVGTWTRTEIISSIWNSFLLFVWRFPFFVCFFYPKHFFFLWKSSLSLCELLRLSQCSWMHVAYDAVQLLFCRCASFSPMCNFTRNWKSMK